VMMWRPTASRDRRGNEFIARARWRASRRDRAFLILFH
jgi:hypothetical protein